MTQADNGRDRQKTDTRQGDIIPLPQAAGMDDQLRAIVSFSFNIKVPDLSYPLEETEINPALQLINE